MARLNSERLRIVVFEARFNLRAHNTDHNKDMVFVKEGRSHASSSTRHIEKRDGMITEFVKTRLNAPDQTITPTTEVTMNHETRSTEG